MSFGYLSDSISSFGYLSDSTSSFGFLSDSNFSSTVSLMVLFLFQVCFFAAAGCFDPAERSEADQPRPISRSVVIGLHELQAEQVAVPAIYLL